MHSVSLKGGQTTPEARITAPTAVSIQSKRVQFSTQELPACTHSQSQHCLTMEDWTCVDVLVLTAKSSDVPFSLVKVQETFLQEPQHT